MVEQNELLPDAGIDDTLDLLANLNREDVPRHRWPEQLAALVDLLVAAYKRRGRNAEEAMDEAQYVVLAQALYLGGKPMYLAKGDALEAALRHARIWHEFNGRNAYELADKHGLTLRQVQNIIAEQMRYRRGLRQGALPLRGENE